MIRVLVLVMLTVPAYAQTGLGKSTFTCLDKDGDGYGVGPGCRGPDADDNDPTVQNASQAIAKYGTLHAFLAHLGYKPNHIFYISTSGNDNTGVMDDPRHPYRTWSKMNLLMGKGIFSRGDMVMFRQGTWMGTTIEPIGGVSGQPVILMAYPGETVWIDNHRTGATVLQMADKSFITVDGLKVTGGLGTSGCIAGGTADNKTSSTAHDIVLRNVEATNCFQGLIFMNGLVNLTMEDNMVHGSSAGGQHCIYIGSSGLPNTNVILRRNICYDAAWNGFHINGRFTNLQVDQNLIYDVGVSGLSLQEGVSNSLFRNNLVFGAVSQALEISNYPGDCAQFGQGGSGAICPYDQTDNLFENNILYQTGFDYATGAVSQFPAVQVYNYSVHKVGDLGHQTFQNNIFVGYGMSGHYPPVVFRDGGENYLATSTFANNIFWSLDGATDPYVIGWGPNPRWGFQGYTCAQAASLTTITDCMNVDPLFINVVPANHGNPITFNFGLSSGSPAISAGTSLGAPSYDILGALRPSPPSIGAFEATSGTSGSPVVVSSITCTPATLNSSGTATCTLELSQNAGAGGATIALSSTMPALSVPVPGSISIPAGASGANFEVEVSAVATPTTATIVATLNGTSVSFTLSLQPSSNQAPVISAVTARSVTSSSATITWTTDQASSSQVAYGTTSAYGFMSVLDSTLVTSHSVTLSGLAASTTYHYQVLSRDSQGNLASSGDFTLKTKRNH